MTRSTKWFLAILALLAFVSFAFIFLFVILISSLGERTEVVTSGSGEKIAVVELGGVITSSEDIIRQIKKYREDRSIKGILLRIESPGGGVVASQEIYHEVRKTREGGKPVVVSMGSIAASGGYYVACGASLLVANQGTLTGSIGVVSEFLQLYEALNKIGVDVKTIKSGKLKDAGSTTRSMTADDQRYFQGLLDDVHQQFMNVVEIERKLTREQVVSISDGRVFTGEQAVLLGLIDTLGTFEDAVAIAGEIAGISGEPSLVRERRKRSFWDSVFGDVTESLTGLKQAILEKPVLSYRFVGPM
ncbi:MAG: signal peptide peptidase SppA [Ignavibacteriae bacterium]|nr:signal peptide peptidase SppA [Ignavibacteriota bacterium]